MSALITFPGWSHSPGPAASASVHPLQTRPPPARPCTAREMLSAALPGPLCASTHVGSLTFRTWGQTPRPWRAPMPRGGSSTHCLLTSCVQELWGVTAATQKSRLAQHRGRDSHLCQPPGAREARGLDLCESQLAGGLRRSQRPGEAGWKGLGPHPQTPPAPSAGNSTPPPGPPSVGHSKPLPTHPLAIPASAEPLPPPKAHPHPNLRVLGQGSRAQRDLLVLLLGMLAMAQCHFNRDPFSQGLEIPCTVFLLTERDT